MMIQQSNCFIVVERGAGMRNLMQERQLASGGEMRQGSNLGGGQMVAADFVMTPTVVFSEGNAGGIGGAAGGLLGGKFAAVAGGLKFKEAQTSMLVADSRSGVQVAAAEGSTKKADLRLGGLLFGGGGGCRWRLRQHERRQDHRGCVHGQLQQHRRRCAGDPSLQRNVGSLNEEAAAGGKTRSGAVFSEGDVLSPKINNIKLLAEPSDSAKALATLSKADELVVTGAEKDGYIAVQGASASGWVNRARPETLI